MEEREIGSNRPKERKGMKNRRWVKICASALAVLLVVLLMAAGVVKYYLSRIDRYDAEDDYTMSAEQIWQMEQDIIRQEREESLANQASKEAAGQTDAPTQPPTEPSTEPSTASTEPSTAPTEPSEEPTEPSTDPTEPKEEKHYEVVNILLIGQDRRNSYERAQSDSMILCSIDKNNNTVSLTSFMRDLYVEIPGQNSNRLNATYPIGGMKLLNEVLQLNFGVEVDANVEVDFAGFEAVIEAMGGVDIDMTEEEVEHLAEFYDYHHLVPGINHLSGEEALAYSRIRYIDSDFQRTGRQRAVLTALLESIRGANLMQLFELLDTILPLIKTDMTDTQIVGYVMDYFSMLSSCEILTYRIPMDGGYEYADERGMAVIKAFPNMTRELLREITN